MNIHNITKILIRYITSITDKSDRLYRLRLKRAVSIFGKTDIVLKYLYSQAEPGDVIYDVGASVGMYSLFLAINVADSLVYAFEPNTPSYQKLLRNIHIMRLDNKVIPMKIALDEFCGKSAFFVSSDAQHSSLHQFNAALENKVVTESLDVDCYSIDDLVKNGICKVPNIIKIDTEGHEYKVIRGAKNILLSKSPKIGFEPHELQDESAKTDKFVKEFLIQFGYEFKTLECPYTGFNPVWCYKRETS